jgi:hypothetical protein
LADAVGPAGARSVEESTARIKPAPVLCLLLTVVLLFGFQGQAILARPLLITLKAVPIILQSDGIFALGSAWAWSWKLPHKVSAPLALIGTSNFLELADAVATGLFGLNSGAEQRTTSLTQGVDRPSRLPLGLCMQPPLKPAHFAKARGSVDFSAAHQMSQLHLTCGG